MSAEVKKEIRLEIAHVLFIDIVGYSKLSINDQRAAIDELTRSVRASEQFQNAEAASRLIKIPTGDGMALVFYKSPEEPVECALEISRALKEHPKLQLRMAAHSGPARVALTSSRQAPWMVWVLSVQPWGSKTCRRNRERFGINAGQMNACHVEAPHPGRVGGLGVFFFLPM
jgi:class 3 adenylate cyclase